MREVRVYKKYCQLTFRPGALGNFAPFFELFHAFLTRLTASEAVRNLTASADDAKFEHVSRGALRDALYDCVRLLE